jgi:hypothetical protein
MTDGSLLIFGCVVTFIAIAGAYVYLRDGFERGPATVEVKAEDRAASVQRVEVHS